MKSRSHRKAWVHDYFGLMDCATRLEQNNVVVAWLNRMLRGIGQVVFANNPLTGILIIIGIAVGDPRGWWFALLGCLGTICGTLSMLVVDPLNVGALDAGLYGFNGFLVGEAMSNFVSAGDDFDGSFGVIILVVILSLSSTFLQRALGNLLKANLPSLTVPFNLVTLMILLASYEYKRISLTSSLDAHIPIKTGLGTSNSVFGTTVSIELCFREVMVSNCSTISDGSVNAIFRGVGQIFFCDNLLGSIIICGGIMLCSRILALFAVVGSGVGLLTAVAFGVDGYTTYHGIWGYNAALTAMALGGFFVVLTRRTLCLAILGAIITATVQGCIAAMFQPWGVPPFTIPFCLVTILFLAASESIFWVHRVAAPTVPENHIEQHKKENGEAPTHPLLANNDADPEEGQPEPSPYESVPEPRGPASTARPAAGHGIATGHGIASQPSRQGGGAVANSAPPATVKAVSLLDLPEMPGHGAGRAGIGAGPAVVYSDRPGIAMTNLDTIQTSITAWGSD